MIRRAQNWLENWLEKQHQISLDSVSDEYRKSWRLSALGLHADSLYHDHCAKIHQRNARLFLRAACWVRSETK